MRLLSMVPDSTYFVAFFKKVYFLLVLIVFQFPFEEVRSSDIPYRHYTIQDGLPHENISTIEQTLDGRLWVGTSAGLAFYAGRQFNPVRFIGSTGTVNVVEIEPTLDNEIWVSTNHQGIWKVRYSHAKQPYAELSTVRARRIIERNDSLYVFSRDQLWVADLKSDALSSQAYRYPVSHLRSGVEDGMNYRDTGVVSADITEQGAKWVLDRHHGPGRLIDGKIHFLRSDRLPQDDGWYAIRFDQDGVGWLTNEYTGLYRFDPFKETFELVIAAEGVRHICVTPTMVVVTSYNRGALYWDIEASSFVRSLDEQVGFPTNRINCMFRDRENTVWVGTQVGLVQMSHPGVTHLDDIQDIPLVNMTRVVKHSDQSIWAVSQTEGLFQLYPERRIGMDFTSRWTDLFSGQDGRIHVLSQDGWYAYDEKKEWYQVQSYAGGQYGEVDVDGIGYFKHANGLFRHEESMVVSPLHTWNPNEQDRYEHALSSDGRLIVWDDGRVVQVDKHAISHSIDDAVLIKDVSSFKGRSINDMLVDDAGRTWVALLNDGLLCIDPDTVMQLLPGHQIDNLSVSGDSLLVASAKEGLYVFNFPKKSEVRPGVHLEEEASIRYHLSQVDGLLSSIVSGAVFSDEFLWINHPAGVTQVPRALLQREPPIPQVLLTSINYNGIVQPPGRIPALSAHDRNIGFAFAATSFSQPHRVLYRYRLKGYSERWEETDESWVQYANLPAGDYTFEVQAAAASQKFGKSAFFDFEIPQPYYQRPFFWLAILFLTTSLMYWLHRYRLNTLLQVERTRMRIAMDLHDDIGSSLTSLSFLSNLAWQRSNKQAKGEEVVPLLKEISTLSSELVDGMLDIVWSVDPKQDSVGSVIHRLQAFYQRMEDAAQITMNWNVETGIPEISLPPRSRRSLYLTMKEAINNSIKHSGSPTVDVLFGRGAGMLHIQVRDYGKGLDVTKEFTGYGLNTMQERAQEEGGVVEFHSKIDEGTTLFIKWPVKNHA